MKKPKHACPTCGQALPKEKRIRTMVRITEVAAMLGCSTKTVQRRTEDGTLHCVPRFGKNHRRYSRVSIERYIKTLGKRKTT